MRQKKVIGIVIICFLISTIPNSIAHVENNLTNSTIIDEQHNQNPSPLEHGIMRPTGEMIKEWKMDYEKAEKAYINEQLIEEITATSDYSILDLVNYIPSERDQGWCGNCWAWPATSVVEIALYIQEGIFNRLSVQYINSCGYKVGVGCCEGGNLDLFCQFYRLTDKAIPWSNTNAEWQDNRRQCDTDCDSIETEPYYPISSIYPVTIETHDIPEEEAIMNIKNVLHQQKGVYFSFVLPDQEYLTDFNDFWSDELEDDIYLIDWDCGAEYIEGEGAGHAVLCVGYNDDEGTENDYWVMLNSWGTTIWRPEGLFRINMHMDYDCTIKYQGRYYYSFDFETLNVTFSSDDGSPNPPTIQGPSSTQVDTPTTYTISTTDPQNDDVYYQIEWDDGASEDWIGPYSSGEEFEINHTWTEKDSYVISVKAKDINEDESLWSTFEVSLPKRKAIDFSWLHWVIEHFFPQFPFPFF